MKECEICKTCFSDEVTVCPNDGQPIYRTISGEPILDSKYTLEKRLGQGGMGVVYRARHSYLKTLHAIKIILPDLVGNDPSLVTRFRQEALASAAIRHQNIVNVTDFGVAQEKMPFLVMDYIQGESLQDLLAREKRLSPETAMEILQALCAGVGAAHRQGIVHRDLKPLNIMLQANRPYSEGVKVLDFGLAKIKSGELLGSFIQAQTTGLMGSPYYMSPEQWSDEEPDARADVYSLGVILHQMLTGDVPFKGSSIPAIMKKHLSDNPPCFANLNVDLPKEFEDVICHALTKTRRERTASVEDLANEMRTAVYAHNPPIHQSYTPSFSTAQRAQTAREDVFQETGSGEKPVRRGTVRILSIPAEAEVFINNSSIGKTSAEGWLARENVPYGKYTMRVSREGSADMETEIDIDQPTTQITANLRDLFATNVVPNVDRIAEKTTAQPPETAQEPVPTNYPVHTITGEVGRRSIANEKVSVNQNFGGASQAPRKKNLALPLAAAGAIGLAALGGIGFGAYKMLGGNTDNANVSANVAVSSNAKATPSPTAPVDAVGKNEMVNITGGTFQMGRNDGALEEQPAHAVTVKDFWIDKTEVTNGEYAEFVEQTKYPAPSHFQHGKPLSGQEARPVVFVSLEDARAFAKWRSKRDGVEYRVPSEAEWEYVARNGTEATLYPWGSSWQENRAVINGSAPRNVSSVPDGNSKNGVSDLIGNVWEWTDSPASLYEGNNAEVNRNVLKGKFLIRGACFQTGEKNMDALTATFRRVGFEPTKKHETIGFRLVRN